MKAVDDAVGSESLNFLRKMALMHPSQMVCLSLPALINQLIGICRSMMIMI